MTIGFMRPIFYFCAEWLVVLQTVDISGNTATIAPVVPRVDGAEYTGVVTPIVLPGLSNTKKDQHFFVKF